MLFLNMVCLTVAMPQALNIVANFLLMLNSTVMLFLFMIFGRHFRNSVLGECHGQADHVKK
jgi:hypothetical protein